MPDIRQLALGLAKIAREELNEKSERIAEDIEALRSWINKTPHLKSRTDDQFLVAFLRSCKYGEKVKSKLENYYETRKHLPEIIRNRDPLEQRTLSMIRLG